MERQREDGLNVGLSRTAVDVVPSPPSHSDTVGRHALLLGDGTAMSLTRREVELCELMRLGLANKEIATRMNLTKKTVEVHIHNIKKKVGYDARAIWAASLLVANAKT